MCKTIFVKATYILANLGVVTKRDKSEIKAIQVSILRKI